MLLLVSAFLSYESTLTPILKEWLGCFLLKVAAQPQNVSCQFPVAVVPCWVLCSLSTLTLILIVLGVSWKQRGLWKDLLLGFHMGDEMKGKKKLNLFIVTNWTWDLNLYIILLVRWWYFYCYHHHHHHHPRSSERWNVTSKVRQPLNGKRWGWSPGYPMLVSALPLDKPFPSLRQALTICRCKGRRQLLERRLFRSLQSWAEVQWEDESPECETLKGGLN